MPTLLFLFLACSQAPDSAEPVAVRVAAGEVCTQLDAVSVSDLWGLPGRDEPGATDEVRIRVLAGHPDWATRCTVNRMGGMDVGPSCELTGATQTQAEAVYAAVERDFRSCHAGWMLMDEADETTREVVAEKDGAIRFVRIRDNAERGWQVSIGAMPL